MPTDNRTTRTDRSKVETFEIARNALSRGLLPIPLKSRGKRPIGNAWQEQRVSESTIERVFAPDNNVGILWGRPSNWIVDIDLDCEEAVRAAQVILPATFVYGRDNRPRSHYLVKSPRAKTKKYFGPEHTVLVEIRASGTQSVFAGSQHPDGDFYRIDTEEDFAELPPSRLYRYCSEIAACAILAQNYPGEGARHDFIHALAGALKREGRSIEEIKRIVLGTLAAAMDHEDDPEQRVRTLLNTLESDGQTYGWNTFRKLTKTEPYALIRKLLLKQSQPVPVSIEIQPPPGPRYRPELAPPREGLIHDLEIWAWRRSFTQQPGFETAMALAATALASGNRYLVDHWRTPLQPYLMILAPTGGGKDSVYSNLSVFARETGLHERVYSGFQSFHSMIDTLAQPPSIACWLFDECARKMKSASKPNSPDYALMTYLIGLYGKGATGMPGMPGRRTPVPPIDKPFLITVGATQPAQLVEAVSHSDVVTGLLSRFILFDSHDQPGKLNAEHQDIFPTRILRRVQAFQDVELESDTGFRTIRLGEGVYPLFFSFAKHAHEQVATVEHGELWNRANQNALIIAGLYAVGIDPFKPIITAELAEYAIEMAQLSVENWLKRLSGRVADNPRERNWNHVLQMVGNPQSLAREKRWRPEQRALLKRGLMPRGVLVRLCRGLTKRELDEVIGSLEEADLIASGDYKESTVYWKPGVGNGDSDADN